MNYTILLQGRIEKRALDFWANNFANENICISIWEDDIEYYFPKNWTIVKNKKPIERLGLKEKNLDLQLISTIEGLKCVETKYVIKMRCDEYYSNIQKIIDKLLINDEKIVCGSIFFRPIGKYSRFHISDHIIAGKLENIKIMFQKTFENIKNNFNPGRIPESQLGLAYLCEKESDLKNKIGDINHFDFDNLNLNIIDEKELLKKYFEIIDINLLKPYLATFTYNGENGRKWYESNFDNENCITSFE